MPLSPGEQAALDQMEHFYLLKTAEEPVRRVQPSSPAPEVTIDIPLDPIETADAPEVPVATTPNRSLPKLGKKLLHLVEVVGGSMRNWPFR